MSETMRYFATSSGNQAFDPGEYAEVGLAHFAAILGLTRRQYARHMVTLASEGRLFDLLRYEARCEAESWISENGLVESGEQFCVIFRLSLNMTHDTAMFNVCHIEQGEEGPVVVVDKTTMGLMEMPPDDVQDMEKFEFMFCDLETTPM